MPASLVDSQLATLEEPEPDEHAVTCDIQESPQQIVDDVIARAST
jgi:gluconate kinase